MDRPTVISLGVRLPLTGDDDFDSTVTVRVRVQGTGTYQDALPLYRGSEATVACTSPTVAARSATAVLEPATPTARMETAIVAGVDVARRAPRAVAAPRSGSRSLSSRSRVGDANRA